MGGIIACVCCYCCLTALKPKCIEIFALVCNIIEIITLLWVIIDIPWKDISIGGIIIFFVSCIFIILSFIILLFLICLRCNNKINENKNGTGKCLCLLIIILLILSEILIIIDEIIILFNMDEKNDFYSYYDLNENRKTKKYAQRKWASVIIGLTFVEIALGFHIYCISFLIKLIYVKTNLSYLEYIENQKDNNSIFSNSINIFNKAHNHNINQLNVYGYNKNVNPSYNFPPKQENVNICTNITNAFNNTGNKI